MATTTETIKLPDDDEGFDPLEFWLRHRRTILALLLLVLIGLAIFSIYQIMHQREEAASHEALATATKPEDFQKVIERFAKLPAEASAQLRLAQEWREAGKYDESNGVLKSFIEQHPQHPLLPGAYMSMAANDEDAGKLDQALTGYKRVLASYPTSYAAAAAWVGQGRVLQAQGKTEEARHAYETVITQIPDSPFTAEAFRASQKLKK